MTRRTPRLSLAALLACAALAAPLAHAQNDAPPPRRERPAAEEARRGVEPEGQVLRRTIERRLELARRSVEAFEDALRRLEAGEDAQAVRRDLAGDIAPELTRITARFQSGRRERRPDDDRRPPPEGEPGAPPHRGMDGRPGASTPPPPEAAADGFDPNEPVTDEDRELIQRIVTATVPPLGIQLEDLCDTSPDACEQRMQQLRARFAPLLRDGREDPVLFDLRLEEIRVVRDRFMAARRYIELERGKAPHQILDEAAKRHRDLVVEQFNIRAQLRAHTTSTLETQIRELEEQRDRIAADIRRDEQNRDRIIEEQVDESLEMLRSAGRPRQQGQSDSRRRGSQN